MIENTTPPIKLMIVEDHEIVRLGLRLTLQSNPSFEVVGEAGDGPDAVEKASLLLPDVILMDIGLKTISGIETVKLIKANLPNMKILMVTSHDSDDAIFAALSAGADGYCLKSISEPQLSIAINTVHSGAAWLDPGIAKKVFMAQPQTKATKGPGDKFTLTAREHEVLGLIVDGLTNQQIASKLCLSAETVKTHVSHVMEKMLVSDRTQAAVKALKQGYL